VLAAAGGGALAVVVLIVGLVLLLRGGKGQQQVEEDREAREQAAPVNEFPPVAWTLQPAPGPKLAFPDALAVSSPDRFAWEVVLPGPGPEYLSVEPAPGGRGGKAVHFGRFDLKTGQPVGPSMRLKGQHRALKPSAVAPDGTLVLGLGPGSLFQIYGPKQDTPRTIPGLSPVDSRRLIKDYWFDFSDDSRLWLLKDGTLVAWDLTAGKSAFTATGRYTLPALMGPDRKWLIAQVDEKYLEVLDAATGACRGRFGGEGRWRCLAVSLDGKRLAAGRFPGSGFDPGANAYDFPFDLHEWDLTTGERKAIVTLVRKLRAVKSVHWIDADRLLFEEALVDMKRRMHLANVTVKSPPGSKAPGMLKEAGWTADGRRWANVGLGQLVPVVPPLDALAGEPAFRPGDAVTVEARCGADALDSRVVAILSGAAKQYGFRVEKGGWLLRVSAAASDTGMKIGEVPVPEVKGTVELVAPEGAVAATSAHRGVFPMGPGTKYYKGTEREQFAIPNPGRTDLYNFRGRSPADAMREEAWTHFIRTLPDSPWPRAAWKSGGQYVRLPLTLDVDPKPKAK
jgi:hypothetical protein